MTAYAKKIRLLLNIILAFTLTACVPGAAQYSGAASLMRNEVFLVRLNHEIDITPEAPFLSEAARSDLDHFLALIDVRYGDQLSLDYGASEISYKGRAEIAGYFQELGLNILARSPVSNAAPLPGHVMLIVERHMVKPPICVAPTGAEGPNRGNGPSPEFGCSQQTLLGLMVANPRHLLQSAGDAGPLADPAIRAVGSVREGTVQNNANKGISLLDGLVAPNASK